MKKLVAVAAVVAAALLSFPSLHAQENVVCKDGVCYFTDAPDAGVATQHVSQAVSPRLAQGYMTEREFLRFLDGSSDGGANGLADAGMMLAVLLILLGGLAMNLTPCVLPMVPVNLMIIGKSARRGAAYGLGITLAYGALGLAAAFGGLAFGAIQSSPWFNLAVAAVFVVLGLALSGVVFIDLSGLRASAGGERRLSDAYAFFMGALSALLAGSCVAPVLIAVLLLTADLYSKGNAFALALPFVMGLGMALPWPLAGAGMKVLPKPGMWMKWVNRVFAVVVFGFAAWYSYLAFIGFSASAPSSSGERTGYVSMTVDNFSLDGLKRPVLVDCWASWCKNCSAMDGVLARPAVVERLAGYTVVKLQAEDMGKLVALPGFASVKGLPAFLVFED
jgi:thiol:disulfide interchange protein